MRLRLAGREMEADELAAVARSGDTGATNAAHHLYKRLTEGQDLPELPPLEIVRQGGQEIVREMPGVAAFPVPLDSVKPKGGTFLPGFGHDRATLETIFDKWDRKYKSDEDRNIFVGGLHYYLRRTHYGPPYPPRFFSALAAELVKMGRGPE